MAQVFRASPTDTMEWPNGAIGHRPGGSFDCLGPYAKVKNCPIAGTSVRLTCYASGYATDYYSVPANTKYRGKYIRGFFSHDGENGPQFHVMDSHKANFSEFAS